MNKYFIARVYKRGDTTIICKCCVRGHKKPEDVIGCISSYIDRTAVKPEDYHIIEQEENISMMYPLGSKKNEITSIHFQI